MSHHVIYVPGLSDHRTKAQRWAPLYWWPFFGVRGHCYFMHWNDKEAFAPKLERLLQMIDSLAQNGDKVSLVGASAGASVVLAAYAARQDKVAGVACISGKINHPETVSPAHFIENPAFQESLAELQRILPKLGQGARARIMSIRPLRDGSVAPADTIIPGAREEIIPTAGHAFSIVMALTFCAYPMLKFLKRQATE